jgi:hypothetical protein
MKNKVIQWQLAHLADLIRDEEVPVIDAQHYFNSFMQWAGMKPRKDTGLPSSAIIIYGRAMFTNRNDLIAYLQHILQMVRRRQKQSITVSVNNQSFYKKYPHFKEWQQAENTLNKKSIHEWYIENKVDPMRLMQLYGNTFNAKHNQKTIVFTQT